MYLPLCGLLTLEIVPLFEDGVEHRQESPHVANELDNTLCSAPCFKDNMIGAE